MSPWVRASSLDRVLLCPGQLVLPNTRKRSERAEEAANWGTMVHRWAATGVIKAEPGWEKHEKLFDPTHVDREYYWPSGLDVRREMAFARNTVTKEIRRYDGGTEQERDEWKKSHGPEWETGSADYLGEIFGDLWIDDIKSGAWPPVPPGESMQLRWYALAAARSVGHTGDVCGSITHYPRYPKGKQPQRYWARLTGQQLNDLEKQMERTYATLQKGPERVTDEDLVPSQAACEWCDAIDHCPEQQAFGEAA